MGPRRVLLSRNSGRSTDCALIAPERLDTRAGAAVDDGAANGQKTLNAMAEALTYQEELIATSREL